jgi:hypothetical protein
MGRGAGGPTRWGGGGSRGCGERRRFLLSPCGGGCSQVPISTFLIFFSQYGADGGMICTKAWRPDTSAQIGRPDASSTVNGELITPFPFKITLS